MNKAATLKPKADDAAEMQATITQYLSEMERLREQMNHDQTEIEGSQARTRAMLADLKQAMTKAT